jgi:hypothetical protein
MDRRDHEQKLKKVGSRATWWELAATWLGMKRDVIEYYPRGIELNAVIEKKIKAFGGYQPRPMKAGSKPPQSGSGVPRFTMD